MSRIPCAVLGATGAVGQRFVSLLAGHPHFEPRLLVGDGSAGRTYAEAAAWVPDTPLPASVAGLRVATLAELHARQDIRVAFSALPGGTAGPIEADLAARGLRVFTNARDHRMAPHVPLLVPEVNPDHLALVRGQPGPGWIVANGNCSAIILLLPLAALHRAFEVAEAHVTTMQGLSGAGYPGVSALDAVDNVVPFIAGEEEKLAQEPAKTLGTLRDGAIEPADLPIHATCTRVAVREGHLESVHLRLARPTTLDAVREALAGFRGPPEVQGLPSAPRQPIHVLDGADRPQPRRDRDLENGMAVSVGRLRLSEDGRDLRFVLLGHNTLRGAAGQSVLNAEFARATGYL
jgi:aspartate-semialdehyde dehydrogenase